MATSWKILGDTLGITAQHLPPLAGTAVGLVATVANLTSRVLEMNEVSKENQQLVEQLAERALGVSRIIEQYVTESRPQDDIFTRFVSVFHATMTDVRDFLEKSSHRGGWIHRLVESGAVKAQFAELWRRLDAVAGEFRTHMLRNMVSSGPYDRIQHPQLREFWKQSMSNVLEAKWIHFWDQLLHDFPDARPFLSGPSASNNKVRLQAKAFPRDTQCVGPWEINNLFKDPKASVGQNLGSVLRAADEHGGIRSDQSSLSSTVAAKATRTPSKICIEAPTIEAREVQIWKGYWMQGSRKDFMEAELFFAADHKVYGGGTDIVGEFTWTGETRGTEVHLTKQYIGRHKVEYGGEMRDTAIDGTWAINGGLSGSGTFHLKCLGCKSIAGREVGIVEIGQVRKWTGYYKQGGRRSNMSAEILFTNSKYIFGSGRDSVGRFTWLGRYDQGSRSISVDMIKQYEGMHPVYYLGAIARQEDLKVVMEGSWVLSDGIDAGTFYLQPN